MRIWAGLRKTSSNNPGLLEVPPVVSMGKERRDIHVPGTKVTTGRSRAAKLWVLGFGAGHFWKAFPSQASNISMGSRYLGGRPRLESNFILGLILPKADLKQGLFNARSLFRCDPRKSTQSVNEHLNVVVNWRPLGHGVGPT